MHQQARQFVRQDKHGSVSALQTAHGVFRLLHSPAPPSASTFDPSYCTLQKLMENMHMF